MSQNENTEIDFQGLILDENTISKNDFLLGDDNKIKIPENANTAPKIFYNQAEIKTSKPYEDTRWSCVLFGNMGAISDLTGYQFTREDILEIQRLAVDHFGLKVPGGMYIHKGVDLVRAWWNKKFPENQLKSFRLRIGDDDYNEALKQKHTLVVGYRTSSEYSRDSQDDGLVSGTDFPKVGGHCVRGSGIQNISIHDNYIGLKKYNTYQIENITELQKNNVYFPSAYLFLKDTSIEDEIINNIDLDKAKEMFYEGYWNGLNPRANMSRQEVMTVIGRLRDEMIEKYGG